MLFAKPIVVCMAMLLMAVGISYAQADRLKFRHLTVDNGLPQNSVLSIVKDKYGFMWFATWGGAVRYDGYRLQVFRAAENDTLALPDNRIGYIVADSAKNIWVQAGDYNFLYKYRYEDEQFERVLFGEVPQCVRNQMISREGGIAPSARNNRFEWRAQNNKLVQRNLNTGREHVYSPDRMQPFSLSDNIINAIYLDDQDNIWIGTHNGGVNHARLTSRPFAFEHTSPSGNGLIDNVVRTVCVDNDGRTWVGAENMGITVIERTPNGNNYKHIGRDKIRSVRVRYVYCDNRGDVWVGTKAGLFRYNKLSDSFDDCSAGICDPNVFAVFEDHNYQLWVGTYNGLAQYDRQTGQFDCLGEDVVAGKQVRAIIEDRRRCLWVATEDAGVTRLQRINGADGSETFLSNHYIHKDGNEQTPISNRVYSLAEDADGFIWMATNAGLSRLNPDDNTFTHFTIKNGLPDDIAMGVLFDGKASLWVSHKKGLTRIDTHTFEMQSFNVNDGLQGNEFNQNACFRDASTGEMFFGGTNGLNTFFPDSIKSNPFMPRPVFTRLTVMNQTVRPGQAVNGRVILDKSLTCSSDITLTWHHRTVAVEFSALHFANPLGNKYRYRLEGYDRQWQQGDASSRTAIYSQLPAGRYVLKVYAANSDGLWCDTPALLNIRVLPPWWLTWWAVLFYVAVAVALGFFVWRYIASRMELRKNEELHRAKLRFFTEVSHEFRTPLTLIVDPLERLLADDVDSNTIRHMHHMMHRNAKQLLLLINQLLDFRKLESGHLSLALQTSNLVAFVRSVAASFEARATERGIRFEVRSAVEQLEVAFDSSKINMVLNNLLSNAFKFTPNGGSVSVTVGTEGNNAVMVVSDTGMGIAKAEQEKVFEIFYQTAGGTSSNDGSGIGLALTKELVLLHGGSITLESGTGMGACFTVLLPLQTSAEATVSASEPQHLPLSGSTALTSSASADIAPDHAPFLLVVDDNADIRNYIEMSFGRTYNILTATNGNEGFSLAIDTIPDLVVSDVMMPGTDGLALCRLLKSDQRTSHIPVILLTARHSDEAKTEGFETGADAYVTKPFSTLVLQAQIRNLLEQRQRLRELFSRGTAIEMKKIAINTTDEAFLKKVTGLVDENMGDENFNIDSLAEMLKMSRSQFYRKIKALTNQSLHEFVTVLRMNKALELLLSGRCNISETAYRVGYGIPNNFTRAFAKHFGMSPTAYLEQLKE
jgi:signal transduction histidine kinase/ligand-binding sensor domain-containing protein/DNA-binding response OmpR family regulator